MSEGGGRAPNALGPNPLGQASGHRVDDLVGEAQSALTATPFAASPREARLLLGHVLDLSEAQLIARGDEEVPAPAVEGFHHLLRRRLRGEPVAYLFGEREFYGRPFAVDPRVLIPRPETEHLVEEALAVPLPARPRVLDLCTGSGCVAVTLAAELPGARVTATDRSAGATVVAADNIRRHGVGSRVQVAVADLGAALALDTFDLVVSNPPYVAEEDRPRLSVEVVDFEPGAALFAGPGGTSILRRLVDESEGLAPGTHLLLEIGDGQLPALDEMVTGSALERVGARRDLAGKLRVAKLRRR